MQIMTNYFKLIVLFQIIVIQKKYLKYIGSYSYRAPPPLEIAADPNI